VAPLWWPPSAAAANKHVSLTPAPHVCGAFLWFTSFNPGLRPGGKRREYRSGRRHGGIWKPCSRIGERARLGRRGTRPRAPLGGMEFTHRLMFPDAPAFGARARRTTAGAAVLPGLNGRVYGLEALVLPERARAHPQYSVRSADVGTRFNRRHHRSAAAGQSRSGAVRGLAASAILWLTLPMHWTFSKPLVWLAFTVSLSLPAATCQVAQSNRRPVTRATARRGIRGKPSPRRHAVLERSRFLRNRGHAIWFEETWDTRQKRSAPVPGRSNVKVKTSQEILGGINPFGPRCARDGRTPLPVPQH